MTPAPREILQPTEPDELEPELARLIEALARAHARDDYRAARAAQNRE